MDMYSAFWLVANGWQLIWKAYVKQGKLWREWNSGCYGTMASQIMKSDPSDYQIANQIALQRDLDKLEEWAESGEWNLTYQNMK